MAENKARTKILTNELLIFFANAEDGAPNERLLQCRAPVGSTGSASLGVYPRDDVEEQKKRDDKHESQQRQLAVIDDE